MLISIAAAGSTPAASIPEALAEATHLFIVRLEDNQCLKLIDGREQPQRDVFFARQTQEWDCEAIVCGGAIEKEAFDILADAQITRYDGYLFQVSQVRKQLYTYQLPPIRDYVGGSGCHGHAIWQEQHPEDK